ncbi:MAG: ATP-binding protein [Cyanobacteriota bacterium]
MPKNIDELPEGGRGIKLIWQLADEFSYTQTPNHQNCLLIVKSYESKTLTQSPNLPKENFFKPLINFSHSFNFLNGKQGQSIPNSNIPLHNIHLTVNTDLQAVSQVLDWYEQLNDLPIPPDVVRQGQLALIEGFTNAVRHAHKGMPLETPIKLEIRVFEKRLEMRVWDYGKPFDLHSKLRGLLTEKS